MCRHTVKFNKVVLDALQQGAAAGFLNQQTLFLCLAHVELEHDVQRGSNKGEDDGERAKAPSPVVVFVVEVIGSLGTSERGDDIGRRGKGVGQPSILQLGRVGGDNVHTVCHAAETD